MEKKTLGSFIAVLRKAKGLTQQELADILNVSNKAVSKWECNETCPDISLLPVIAEVLEVSCDELLRGERILSGEKTERTEKRGEKQLKYMANKNVFKYKNISLISIILIFIGLVLMYTISYSAYRPDIGFTVAVSLFFVAVVVQIFALGWLNNITAGNELLEDNKTNNDLLQSINNTKYKYSFWIFYSVFFLIFLILPLWVFRDSVIVNSVLTLKSYLEYVPLFILLPTSLVFVIKELYKKAIIKDSAKFSKILIFDLVQIGLFFITFIISFVSLFYYFYHAALGLYLYIILMNVIGFSIIAIIARNKKTIAKIALITVRNTAYLAALGFFFAASYIVTYNGINEYIEVITSRTSLISGIIIAITTLIYFLLTKNKNIYVKD